MTSKTNSLTDAIKARFKASGLTLKSVSDRSGVPYASVHAFLARTSDARLSTVERICDVIGLELRAARKRKG